MSRPPDPSRRTLLKGALAASGIGLAARARAQAELPTPSCHDGADPTESNIEGPFYKPRSPERSDLLEPGTRAVLYQLEGFVLTRSCQPVPGAILDLWHADEKGDYDETGFRYRGHLFVGADGHYRFRTVMPGLYPGRTRHYHFKVAAPRGRILTTQLYFPNEPRNQRDDYFLPELLMRIAPSPSGVLARFDFILDII